MRLTRSMAVRAKGAAGEARAGVSENTDHVASANRGSQQVVRALTVVMHAEEWRETILMAVGHNCRSVTFDFVSDGHRLPNSCYTAYHILSTFLVCTFTSSVPAALTSRPAPHEKGTRHIQRRGPGQLPVHAQVQPLQLEAAAWARRRRAGEFLV